MPSAQITVNGVPGSNDALPLNTLVQLNNVNSGGEVTYLWELLDQPDGAADALSSSSVQNPTFTPRKEGTYLLRLTVNLGLATQLVTTAVAAVRHLKTNERAPAAFEVFEDDAAKGWKTSTNRWLNRVDALVGDANVLVCVLSNTGVPALGDVVAFAQVATIKAGLPGQTQVPLVVQAPATSLPTMRSQHLGVVVGTPTGGPTAPNGLALVRRVGLSEVAFSGSPSVGDLVFVSDANRPSLTPGTNPRLLGKVVSSGAGTYQVFVDGSTFGLMRTDEMSAIADGRVVANWSPNVGAGYVASTGSGDLFVPLRIRQGERLVGLVFSRFGDGAVNITATVNSLSAAGSFGALATATVPAAPAAWSDTTFGSLSLTPNAGDALYVDFFSSAANARVGTVRASYLITP